MVETGIGVKDMENQKELINAIDRLAAQLIVAAHEQASAGALDNVHYLVSEERRLFQLRRRVQNMVA